MAKKWTLKNWVDNWKHIAPILQEQNDNDIRNSNTAESIEQLDWSYRYIRDNYPVASHSGMVDFYRILLKNNK